MLQDTWTKGYDERQSFFHALNQKSVARKAAKEIERLMKTSQPSCSSPRGSICCSSQEGRARCIQRVCGLDGSMGRDGRGGALPNASLTYASPGKTQGWQKKIIGHEVEYTQELRISVQ